SPEDTSFNPSIAEPNHHHSPPEEVSMNDRRRARAGSLTLLAGMILVAGCDPGATLVEGQQGANVDEALARGAHMRAVGCVERSEPGVGLRLLPGPQGEVPLRFDCEGVAPDSIEAAYRRELFGPVGDSEIASVVSGYWSWVTTFSTYACGAPAYAYTISGEQTIGGYIGVSVGGGQSLEVWVDPGYYRINVYTQPVCNVLDVSEAV